MNLQLTKNKKMKTLLYLASGPYYEEYESLPYDKVILVDSASTYANYRPGNNSKVEFMNMDAMYTIKALKERNIKIDCLVSLNEGLLEGGGLYPIFSDFLIGYLSPILNDEILVISDPDYYGALRMSSVVKNMDWGFVGKKVKPNDAEFIYPGIFSSQQRALSLMYDKKFGQIKKLIRNRSEHTLNMKSKLTVKLIHGSIWENSNADLIGIGLSGENHLTGVSRNVTIKKFFHEHNNFRNIHQLEFNDIIRICEEKKLRTISLAPWKDGDYEQVIRDIQEFDGNFPAELNLYHLNKTDFAAFRDFIDN